MENFTHKETQQGRGAGQGEKGISGLHQVSWLSSMFSIPSAKGTPVPQGPSPMACKPLSWSWREEGLSGRHEPGSGLTPAWPELRAFLRNGRRRRKRSDVHASSLLYLLSASHPSNPGDLLPKGFTNPGEGEKQDRPSSGGVGALADGQ